MAARANAPAHSQASLPALPPHLQSDTHLTAHLASRFHVSLPTAKLSSQGLICLNTYTSSTRGPNGEKAGSAMGEAEEVARRAWARLGSRGEDQAFVFLYVWSRSRNRKNANCVTAESQGLARQPLGHTSSRRS